MSDAPFSPKPALGRSGKAAAPPAQGRSAAFSQKYIRYRRTAAWLVPLLILSLGAAGVVVGLRGRNPQPGAHAPAPAAGLDSRERALAERFEGSYPTAGEQAAKTHEYTLTAAPAQVTLIPAMPPVDVWAYNGQVPGPVLRVPAGERLRVVFRNRLPQTTTIHWHGIRVPNAMDGVPGVTQPPIEPGSSFTYDFVPRDPGTFWFHPHVRGSEQVERGLQGVVVVQDREPAAWSQDVVWVVDDWRLTQAGQIDPRFNTHHDLMHDGRWGNVITTNGHADEQLVAKPGERIRLRLVNTANGRVFRLDFGALQAQAIAVDGMYAAHPFDPNGFELAPGNRIDVDISIRAADRGSVLPVVDRFTRRPVEIARIRVADVPPVSTPAFPTLAHASLPDWSDGLTLDPHLTYRLGARRGGHFGIAWTLNDAVYGEDRPATLPEREWIKVRYINESARLHPMHMHGVFFRVLARNGQPALEPHWRDTVLVHPRETVDIALVPSDRGRWALHCHVLEHAEAGMMTVFQVTTQASTQPPAVPSSEQRTRP